MIAQKNLHHSVKNITLQFSVVVKISGIVTHISVCR